MHYYRLRRTGNAELVLRNPEQIYLHSHGYLRIPAPKEHPLKPPRDRLLYQHRQIFYEGYGEGPFPCHWCGIEIGWDDPDMNVDHLNDEKDDNRLENLVASCARCNRKRGVSKMRKTMKSKGRLLTFNDETMCLSDWARRIGISQQSLRFRLDANWSIDRALLTPKGKIGPVNR